jgi:hypothetical protein
MILYLIYGFGMVTCTVSPLSRFTAHLLPVYRVIYKWTSLVFYKSSLYSISFVDSTYIERNWHFVDSEIFFDKVLYPDFAKYSDHYILKNVSSVRNKHHVLNYVKLWRFNSTQYSISVHRTCKIKNFWQN